MTFEEAWTAWHRASLTGGWTTDDKYRFRAGWDAALSATHQPQTDAGEAVREAEKRIWRVMRRLMTSSCGCDGAYDDGCPECTFEKAQEAAAAIRQQAEAQGDGA